MESLFGPIRTGRASLNISADEIEGWDSITADELKAFCFKFLQTSPQVMERFQGNFPLIANTERACHIHFPELSDLETTTGTT